MENFNVKEATEALKKEQIIFGIRAKLKVSKISVSEIVKKSEIPPLVRVSYEDVNEIMYGSCASALDFDKLLCIEEAVNTAYEEWRQSQVATYRESIKFLESLSA